MRHLFKIKMNLKLVWIRYKSINLEKAETKIIKASNFIIKLTKTSLAYKASVTNKS